MGDEIWVKCLALTKRAGWALSRKAAMAERDQEWQPRAKPPKASTRKEVNFPFERNSKGEP